MDLKPLKKYNNPMYPDKKIVLSNPDILKLVPKRWSKSISTKIAFSSLLIMTLTACGQKYNNSYKNGDSENTSVESSVYGSSENNLTSCVAPIFEHGDGTGSFGCVSISPPAFLSEEEAYQIICDEAKKRGINLNKTNELLEGIQIPVTYTFAEKYIINPDNPDESIAVYPSKTKQTGNLALDGYDKNKKIAFEFVSVDDFKGWQGESSVMSSVEDYQVLDAAETLREGISGKVDDKYIGVFYDPIANVDFSKGDSYVKMKEVSEELLRQQVTDFIEWLKAQNVI